MINNSNKTGGNKTVKILFIGFFSVALLISIGAFAVYYNVFLAPNYLGQVNIHHESDSELISRTRGEEFKQIIQHILEAEKERQALVIQRDKDKNYENFWKALESRRNEIKKEVRQWGSLDYSYFSNGNIEIVQNNNYYREPKFFPYRTYNSYHTQEGYIIFGENNQPDPNFVVDNIDEFHSSGNIKTTVQNVLSKFDSKKVRTEKVTIYVHIEGNLYLYFKANRNTGSLDEEVG